MTCDTWVEALSANADGEDPGVDARLVAAHVSSCPSCRSFADGIAAAGPATKVGSAPTMPDLSHHVARLTAIADRARVNVVLRAVLAGIAIAIAISAIRPLVFGDDGMGMGMSHVARHFGAFSMAYAVGLLVVVARPARARTMLPVAFVVAGALGITAVLDALEGHVTFIAEGRHIPELFSLVLVWLLARANLGAGSAAENTAATLRLVGSEDSADQLDDEDQTTLRRRSHGG